MNILFVNLVFYFFVF